MTNPVVRRGRVSERDDAREERRRDTRQGKTWQPDRADAAYFLFNRVLANEARKDGRP